MREQRLLFMFRSHWRALHRYPLYEWDSSRVRDWFAEWQRNIPDAECNCKEHWRALMIDHFPDTSEFANSEAFFEWTVRVHNLVNERLGKPQLSLFIARQMY